MRISPPGTLKLTSTQLLAELRERLQERAPDFLERLDPTHPAWILLQEAAWMVESMTSQLDEYPYSVVRQFAHLLGAHLRPAIPAVTVVVATTAGRGRLSLNGEPSKWRFFTPQTETHGLVEFSLAEDDVPITAGGIQSLTRLVDGELYKAGGTGGQQHAWATAPYRSDVFATENVRFTLLTSDPVRTTEELQAAAKELLARRQVGWLRITVEREADKVVMTASIDPGAAFADSVSGLTEGGDITARWGELEDTTWTPPVKVADHPLLPAGLRNSRPLPGSQRGEILVPSVPANVPPEQILVRDVRPAPSEIVTAIWQGVSRSNTTLQALRPTIERHVGRAEGEPSWVDGALRQQAWYRIADRPDQTLCHIAFPASERDDLTVRAGWIVERGELPRMRAFALHAEHGVIPDEVPCEVAWHLPLPATEGGKMVQTVALDITVPPACSGVLLTCDGAARGAMLNPVLVINAPATRDGRTVHIQRAIPEPVTLVYRDIVDGGVMNMLLEQGIPDKAAARLSAMPLSRFTVQGGDPIVDFQGVQRDPSDGIVILNAPDDRGRTRSLRRGDTIRLDWYRRTDAANGNVPPGAVSLVEQGPNTRPRIAAVTNPLSAAWGAARETEDGAVQRIFGPGVGVPVTPADWEKVVRHALGTRAEGWMVRCWSHAERALVAHALWPPEDLVEPAPHRVALDQALSVAGPRVLLVALGPRDEVLSDADLDWARQAISGAVAAWKRRLPVIGDVIVTPLWPLELTTDSNEPLPLPSYTLRGVTGTLTDRLGRTSPVPRATLLLNGAIVTVRVR